MRQTVWPSVGVVLWLLAICPAVVAQRLAPLDLLEVDRCVLKAPEGYLDEFWELCVSPTNRETIPVVHLGDSHVQGGYFSAPIRQFFDDYFCLAGLGWVAPYSLLRSNQPHPGRVSGHKGRWSGHFVTSRRYGDSPSPTGITLTAQVRDEVEIKVPDGFPIRRVVLLRDVSTPPLYIKGAAQPAVGVSGVEEPGVDTLWVNEPTTVLTLVAPKGARWYGASLESGCPGPLLHTIGYNGAFFPSLNHRAFLDHLHLLRPRLLIVSLGTNDLLAPKFSSALFAGEVRSLVRALQVAMPSTAILLTSPVATFRVKRVRRGHYCWIASGNADEVSKVLEREASELGCGYIDLYGAFGGVSGADALPEAGMISRDGVHLTREGYDELGMAVAYALLRDFRSYVLRRRPLFYQRQVLDISRVK